jgi:putative ABC transport system permease protein
MESMVDLATKNLLHDKLRFLITVSGVAFSVALVLVQVGLLWGLLNNASITIEKADADLWVTSKNTANVDFSRTFPDAMVQRVRSVDGVLRADNLIAWFLNVALPSGAIEGTLVYAVEDFERWNLPWNIAEGDVGVLRRGPYFFLDESARRRFGEVAVGDYLEFIGRRLKLVGKTREALSFSTAPISFMDFHLIQELSPTELAGNTTYILIKLVPGADVEAVRREIASRLPYNEVLTKKEWAEKSRRYWIESTGLGLSIFVTVFLGALVGVVIVAQTLYTSTMEHLKEFGTVKAIGGSNARIYRLLAKQALIAALVGFGLGEVLVWGLGPLIAKLDLQLIIETRLTVMVFLGTVVLCLAAAMISFRKVAKIDPALVFRS